MSARPVAMQPETEPDAAELRASGGLSRPLIRPRRLSSTIVAGWAVSQEIVGRAKRRAAIVARIPAPWGMPWSTNEPSAAVVVRYTARHLRAEPDVIG